VKHKGDGIREGGMCEGGVLDVHPWRDYYLSLCAGCAGEESTRAERERTEAEGRELKREL
jgi:hypothetical protein